MSTRLELVSILSKILKAYPVHFSDEEIEGSFQMPKEKKFGDLSSTIIMRLAKEVRRPARQVAEEVVQAFRETMSGRELTGRIEKVAVEGPGFINFYFSQTQVSDTLVRICREKESYGRPKLSHKKNILLEFVSANPTGPLTVAHGRQAALGDCLARIFLFCGHEVTKEYYNNDEGVQIQTLGLSLELRVMEKVDDQKKELPENYYRGDYLVGIADQFIEASGGVGRVKGMSAADRLEQCREFAKEVIFEGIKKDLVDFDVFFDQYYSQRALGKSGKVEQTLEALKRGGRVYESEGAVWLRSTEFGDDKDRVLIKSDKNYTYLTPDIAYHHDKFERGFDEIIDILGPDHHGYIARLKASQAALGHDPNKVNVLIAQLVTLYEGDKQVRMSTRAGEFVTLRQILDEVGKDAGRFFFVMRKFDAHLDFDLALAKSQTPDNPVFYIQYAHARIESIKNLYAERVGVMPDLSVSDESEALKFSGLVSPSEIRLMQTLSQFEEAVQTAADTLEPYRLVPYLMDLAASFHRFYTENRIVIDDRELGWARLVLANCTQSVIRRGLALLGVSAPLKM